MKMICEQFQNQKESLYFYVDEDQRKIPNFDFLKNHGSSASEENEDPFLNPKLFSKKDFQQKYEAAEARAKTIFHSTQKLVSQFLEKCRFSFSKKEFQNFSSKIKNVRLASLTDPEIQKIYSSACSRPNAIYIKESNEMLICPSIMNFPEMTLEKILAHEFGHSIQKMQNTLACFKRIPMRQLDEVFADWVSSEVVAQTLRQEKNPRIAKKKALESQMLFLSLACFDSHPHATWFYPTIQNRIEKIFLAQSAFQNAFQCQNQGVERCQ